MKRIIIFIIFICFYSASLFAEILIIKSDPTEAEIFVRSLGKESYVKLGKTPFSMNISEIKTKYANGDSAFIVQVTKKGFDTKNFIMTDMGKSDVDLFVNLELKDDLVQMAKFDELTNKLFESQRLIREKSYEDAIKILESEQILFPNISTIPELIGSSYYLMRDFRKSLTYYKKALEINSKNVHAYQMKLLLEKSLGIGNKEEKANRQTAGESQ
jgi:tetratricopeptide (TPR) repeat protein